MVQLSFSYVAGYLLLLIVNTKSLKYRSLVNVKSTPVFEPLKELYEVKVHGSDNSKWQPALLFIPLVIFGSTAANAEVGTSIADPIQDHGADYYAKYFLAGALSASFSHGVTVPFDVVKTRIQTSDTKVGIAEMLKQIIEKEGPVTLLQGMGPTLSGYALQGGLKYGFYEIFKQIIKFLMHENDFYIDRILMFMIAGGLAETIGTSVLTPFEAARIRLVSNPSYASGIATCITKMIAEDGFGSLYAGLIPIMLKQVPFTILQLSSFEYLTSTIYSKLYDNDYATEDIARFQFLITAAAALVAGFAATMISQPGDTLLSKVNKDKASGESAPTKPVSIDKSGIRPYKKVEKVDVKVFVSSTDKSENVVEKNGTSLDKIVSAARELGIRGLYTGTGARLIQVSVIVVTQLLMYDYIKSLVGMPVTGAGGH